MHDAGRKKQLAELALTLLVIGSVWGFLEMTLGGFLHAIHFPQKGAVMGGIAVSLMAFFTTITGKPALVPLLGVIAALLKPFSAFIYGIPVLSPFIVNPSIAIMLEALAFSVVVITFKKALGKSIPAKMSAGMLAGALGISFYAAVASIFGLGMWATLDLAATIQTALTNALPVALAGGLMLAGGDYAGRVSMTTLYNLKKAYPKAYLTALLTIAILSWTIPVYFGVGI